MIWIDLGNPKPLDTPLSYQAFNWQIHDIETLPDPIDLSLQNFEKIVAKRRTRRRFKFLNRDQLSKFLWLSSRTLVIGDKYLGFPIEQRPVPSSGGIHPIHLLLSNQNDCWLRYDPKHHGLASLGDLNNSLSGIWEAIARVVVPQEGTGLLFVAEPGKINAKYQYGCSLIWRDVGVMIGHMALVAEALNLNFCPLGITGEPWISNLSKQHQFVGVGVALLGSRSDV